LILGTPFFPLIESGFEEGGSEFVNEFSEVELGGSEKLVVGSVGDEFAEPMGLPLGDLEKESGELIGLQLRFGWRGCRCVAHEGSPFRVIFALSNVRPSFYEIIHPLFSCSHVLRTTADLPARAAVGFQVGWLCGQLAV
jgi:hypothetical protein